MAFIKVINESEAKGELKEIYKDIIGTRGKLPNIMKIHSLYPESMVKHMELYKSIMFNKSRISREVKEIIAVIVSVNNKCEYCIKHHSEALLFYWKNSERIETLIKDYNHTDLDDKTKILLKYSAKLTTEPNSISEEDISEIKSFGWNDEDILSVNLIISYFNFVNRIALGLGVEFSEEEIKGYKY